MYFFIMSKINVSIDCVVFGYDEDLELKVLLITKKENPSDLNKHKSSFCFTWRLN